MGGPRTSKRSRERSHVPEVSGHQDSAGMHGGATRPRPLPMPFRSVQGRALVRDRRETGNDGNVAEKQDVLTHISHLGSKITVREAQQPILAIKPNGLWYSVNGDWELWCSSEMPNWLDRVYVHQVNLGDEKLIRIKSHEDLDAFCARYSAKIVNYISCIDWKMVAEEYDGIEIAPYLHERRLDMNLCWYYAWDCASGCIWRPKGIQLIPLKAPASHMGRPFSKTNERRFHAKDKA